MSKKSPKKMARPAVTKVPVAKAKATVRKASAATRKTATKKTVQKAATAAAKTVAKVPTKAAPTKSKRAPVAKAAVATLAPKSVVPKPASAPKSDKTPRVAVAVEGARAPDFNLPRDGGAYIALSNYAGQKLVMFFYPRANTPGCTREAIDFTRLLLDFTAAQTAVIGISADPQKAQESFRDKHNLTVPLLSDETHAMLEAYGAWGEKSMYGKAFQGVFRTTVLIGKDGKVAKIWRNVKVDGHAEEVLETARRT